MTEAVNSGGVKEKKNGFFCFWKIQNCTKITITKFVGKNTRPSSNTSPPTIHWQYFSGVETWIIFFFSKKASLIDLRVSGKHDGTLPPLIYVNKRKPFSHHNTVFQDSQ